jgi:hypothetical protein
MDDNMDHSETPAHLDGQVREFIKVFKESTPRLLNSTPTAVNEILSCLMVVLSELEAPVKVNHMPDTCVYVTQRLLQQVFKFQGSLIAPARCEYL